jgi:murein DD-endopeptidase MepM/ murein hydrolase activator NlpD
VASQSRWLLALWLGANWMAARCEPPEAAANAAAPAPPSPNAAASPQALPTSPGLRWPLACIPGDTCGGFPIGAPDPDGDGRGADCAPAGYRGHEGTDVPVDDQALARGVDVLAAADGEVLWAIDGHHDRCPSDHSDCQPPTRAYAPNLREGTTTCTELGPYCGDGSDPSQQCFWCFAGGNVVVLRHDGVPGVFATRYDHLKDGSLQVAAGDRVHAGQVLAQVGSSGRSTGAHLHFEVWGSGFYAVVDPWRGGCGTPDGLWAQEPPWPAG